MGDILLITYGDILLNPTFKWGGNLLYGKLLLSKLCIVSIPDNLIM